MRTFLLAFVLTFILLFPLWGQQRQTVFNNVASNSAAASVTGMATAIGQDLHTVFGLFSNATGETCTTATEVGDVFLDVSFDNITYFRLATASAPLSTLDQGGVNALSLYAKGSYPYIRIGADNGNVTKCRTTLWYSGNVSGNTFDAPGPNLAQSTTFFGSTTTSISATGDLIAAVAGRRIYVYGLWIYNSTAAQTITINDGTTTFLSATTLSPGIVIDANQTDRPLFVTKSGGALIATLVAGTNVSFYVQYRYDK